MLAQQPADPSPPPASFASIKAMACSRALCPQGQFHLRNGGVDLAPVDMGSVASGLHGGAALGVIAERASGRRRNGRDRRPPFVTMRSMARLPPLVRVGLAVLDIAAEAADAREDRLAGFGMAGDFARQRRRSIACSSVTSPGERPAGSDERFGFSPSPSWT